MVFYTELLGKPVIDIEGKIAGHLTDFVFKDGAESAPIIHIVYLGKDKYKRRLSWTYVEGIKQSASEKSNAVSVSLLLNVSLKELEPSFIHENDLLTSELLDKQIIDVGGVKVVRVNDILLNKVGETLCITGVCVGTTSFFRRLGITQQGIGKLVYRFTAEKIIPWKSVEPLETSKHLLLKESKNKIAELHPGDIADLMEELSPKEQMLVFNKLDRQTAAKTLVEAQPEVQESFFRGLKLPKIVELLESIAPYRAADLLALASDEKVKLILQHMKPEKAKEISELLQYQENTAGALMRTDVFTLQDDQTATSALSTIRKLQPSADKTHILFVTDKEHQLVGTLSLRSLLNASARQKIKDFMKKRPFVVHLQTSKEDIATVLEKYNFFVVPVVDEHGKLKGMITADEVLSEIIPQSWIRRKFVAKRAKKKHKPTNNNDSVNGNATSEKSRGS
ncbi:magnesium transporter [Candidatus Woesearchaeota archaeon]|nr:magnesium transporter [Candidatus Woesearchaeota archaeon]